MACSMPSSSSFLTSASRVALIRSVGLASGAYSGDTRLKMPSGSPVAVDGRNKHPLVIDRAAVKWWDGLGDAAYDRASDPSESWKIHRRLITAMMV